MDVPSATLTETGADRGTQLDSIAAICSQIKVLELPESMRISGLWPSRLPTILIVSAVSTPETA